jgi:hypothetical protein
MSLILTAIGLNAAVGTNFTTVNCLRFHCLYLENLKVIHILAQLPSGFCPIAIATRSGKKSQKPAIAAGF